MAEIIWTLEAAQWLEDIYEYIASESPTSAHKVVTGIYKKIQLLRKHPRLGQPYDPIEDREVLQILYGHYSIAYLVKSEKRIEILGSFHGAMEIDRYLLKIVSGGLNRRLACTSRTDKQASNSKIHGAHKSPRRDGKEWPHRS